jgi:cobalt-zinc-cadmium efflux system protein
MVNSLVLIIGSIIILYNAILRFLSPQWVHVKGMLLFALLGIAVNGLAVWRLRKGKSMNEKVVGWHLLEDVLGWVGVLLISVVMLFNELPILDPLFSIVFTLYILWNVFKNLKQTLMIFLQSTPGDIEIEKIEKKIGGLLDVRGVHDTHVWTMDGEYHILTAHIVVESGLPKEKVVLLKQQIREVVHRFDIEHATLEIEREGEDCILKDC